MLEKWLNNDGKVNFAATKELLKDIDLEAEKLKKEILESKTDVTVKGKRYYVSEKHGDDANDGLSPETAWKTTKNVNDGPVTYHDGVFYERCGIYRGQIKCKAGVTYSAYGEGEKPKIYGSPENGAGEEKWSLVEGTDNIWCYYKPMKETGLIVYNEGEAYSVKEIPSFVNGKYVLRNSPEVEFDVKKHISFDLGHFNKQDGTLTDDKLPNMGVPGPLYVRCDKGNPGKIFNSIEFSVSGHVVAVGGWFNVHIDNLAIMYGGCHGVGAGTCKGLHVTNCYFGWIGGCIQFYFGPKSERYGTVVRFGNSIEIYGGCDDYVCDHNYIYQAYDAGATHQLSAGGEQDCKQKNVKYTRNLFEYCVYSIEYFLGRPDSTNALRFQQNILIKDNIMRYGGFGFGIQRPDKGCVALLKSWDHHNPLDENFLIEGNVFDRSRYMLIHCAATKKEWIPEFNKNIYVQYLGEQTSSLGQIGTVPTTRTDYTENIRELMDESSFDKEGGVYFCERDELYDLPDYSIKK